MADSENEKSSSSETNNLGAGKDVLFGWLVGRAAADLGLAQALAASEAQRAEQFKRLEVSLLAQIQQLQQQQTVGGRLDEQVPDLDELKAHVHNFSERLTWLESVAQQTTQMHELVKTEIALLQSQQSDRHDLIEAHGSRSAKLEESIGAKVAELEQLVDTQAQSFDKANHELQEIKRELGSMAERITGAELATQQNQTQAASDVEGAHERLVGLLNKESAALRAELIARLEQPLPASATKRIEETLQERMDDLQRELEQKFVGRLDVEVQTLQDEMQNLTQRVGSLPTPSAPAVDFNSERSRWSKEVDERITATMQRFDDEIRDKLQTIDSVKAESERSIAETKAFAQQIAQDQQTMQQTTVGLGHELTAIKAGLIEQQNQQQTTEALLKSVKESVRTKLEEIEHYLVHGQNNLENRDAQFSEQKADLQRIAQRIAEVEAMAHQTHALMVNENEQAAQLRDGFRTDLATLQRRLSEQQSMEAVIQGVEDGLTVKLREVQNQLAQKMLLVDRRDAEFRELKAQVQILAQGIASTGTTPPPGQAPAANRIKETAVLAADIGALTPKPEDRLSVASSKMESIPHATHGLHHEDVERGDRLLDGAKNQLTQLQERMSADIERARAELREKSGRWKVRR